MKNTVWAIYWYSQYGKEEIDEANTFKEAKFLIKEYELAYGEGYFKTGSKRVSVWDKKPKIYTNLMN